MKKRLYPLTKIRERRLRRAVTLADAARLADISLARASVIERFPERARGTELDRLRGAIDRAATERVKDGR